MIGTVEQSVEEFQKGNESVFTEIYLQLEGTKSECVKRLRRKIPSVIGEADLEALFDDALLYATNSFKQDKGCSFVTFLKVILEQRSKNLLRSINTEKRSADYYSVPLTATSDADSENDESSNLLATLADESAVSADENLACKDIMDVLKEFRCLSKQYKEYADLIIFDSMVFSSKAEKHAAICAYMGSTVTSSALHKRIKRAKKAFRQYFDDINKNN